MGGACQNLCMLSDSAIVAQPSGRQLPLPYPLALAPGAPQQLHAPGWKWGLTALSPRRPSSSWRYCRHARREKFRVKGHRCNAAPPRWHAEAAAATKGLDPVAGATLATPPHSAQGSSARRRSSSSPAPARLHQRRALLRRGGVWRGRQQRRDEHVVDLAACEHVGGLKSAAGKTDRNHFSDAAQHSCSRGGRMRMGRERAPAEARQQCGESLRAERPHLGLHLVERAALQLPPALPELLQAKHGKLAA